MMSGMAGMNYNPGTDTLLIGGKLNWKILLWMNSCGPKIGFFLKSQIPDVDRHKNAP